MGGGGLFVRHSFQGFDGLVPANYEVRLSRYFV